MKKFLSNPIPYICNVLAIILGVFSIINGKYWGVIFIIFGVVVLIILIRDKDSSSTNKMVWKENEKKEYEEHEKFFVPIYRQDNFAIGIDTKRNFLSKKYIADDILESNTFIHYKGDIPEVYKCILKLGDFENFLLYLNYNCQEKCQIILLGKDENKTVKYFLAPDNMDVEFDGDRIAEYIKSNFNVEITDEVKKEFDIKFDRHSRHLHSNEIMKKRGMNAEQLDKESEFFVGTRRIAYKGGVWDKETYICIKNGVYYKIDTFNTQIYGHRESYPYIFFEHAPIEITSFDELYSSLVELEAVDKYPDLNEKNWKTYF